MGTDLSKDLNTRFDLAESAIVDSSIYFAHQIDIYGTLLEADLVSKIESELGHAVENPAQKHHDENYMAWRNETGNGMDYFERLLYSPKLIGEVFFPFEDGMIGAGVYKEIVTFLDLGKNVWEIDRTGAITSVDSLDSTRILSVDETRTRVYKKKL